MILTQEGRHVVAQLPPLVLFPGTEPHKYFIVLRTLGMMAQSLSLSLPPSLSSAKQSLSSWSYATSGFCCCIYRSVQFWHKARTRGHPYGRDVNRAFVAYCHCVVELYQVMQPTIYKSIIHKCILYSPSEMGGACSAYGGEERRVQGFGGETWGKQTTWETQA
jgi:hypothetical protein